MKKSFIVTISLMIMVWWLGSVQELCGEEGGRVGRYKAILSGKELHPQMMGGLEMAVGAAEAEGYRWWRLTCTKLSGDEFTIWFLAKGDPLAEGGELDVARYILAEGDGAPVEYVNKHTGKAQLPIFGFPGELLPQRSEGDEMLFAKGSYLGHAIERQELAGGAAVAPPDGITKVILDPELLIGTARTYRDNGTGLTGPLDYKGRKDYFYVPYSRGDYEQMVEVGINYVWAMQDQIQFLRDKPIFYEIAHQDPRFVNSFPQELYRSNFYGVVMFIDEPATYTRTEYPEGATLQTAIDMIREHIQAKLHSEMAYYGERCYRAGLAQAGIGLGTLKLEEPLIPIYETAITTSYYQLEVLPYGFIHESRFQITPKAEWLTLQLVNEKFEAEIPVTPENLFRWYYAQMRGPARVFKARWGMGVYGRCQEPLRLPAMTLAYDMGASYLWFWSSTGHDHIPFAEQVRLAKGIKEHAEANPRASREELLRKATTAIVLPYGFTLPDEKDLQMFRSATFPMERLHTNGMSYKEILTPAVRAIERCLKDSISYDVVAAGKDFEPAGYEEVIYLNEDGTVTKVESGK